MYGSSAHDEIDSALQSQVEQCDALSSFFLINSLGGGTGSGLGSHIMQHLADSYGKIWRVGVCVGAGSMDDVVTSPYNRSDSLLSLP